jgi:hypothetical protein
MKAVLILLLGLVACVSLHAQSSEATSATSSEATSKASKAKTIVGMVSDDERSLVADKDNGIWTVANPEALKGYAGHHVSIAAQTGATKNEFFVKSVKMLTPAATKIPKALENNDDRLRVPPPQGRA